MYLEELASGNINYGLIPTYVPVNTIFTVNTTALYKTSISQKRAHPD